MVSFESISFNILPDALASYGRIYAEKSQRSVPELQPKLRLRCCPLFQCSLSCGIKATFRSGTPAQAALALLSVLLIQLKLWQKGESQ